MINDPLFHALILGIVQGITEFLPISSTAHVHTSASLLCAHIPYQKLFESLTQLSAMLGFAWIYRRRCRALLFSFYRPPHRNIAFSLALGVIATIISVLVVKQVFPYEFQLIMKHRYDITPFALILGGLVMVWIEDMRVTPMIRTLENVPYYKAVLIGVMQTLSSIPGVSRSGSTVFPALLMKFDRRTALEFSYLLALPITILVVVDDMLHLQSVPSMSSHVLSVFGVGCLCAFITSIIVVPFIFQFFVRNGFKLVGYYRILAGVGLLLLAGFSLCTP